MRQISMGISPSHFCLIKSPHQSNLAKYATQLRHACFFFLLCYDMSNFNCHVMICTEVHLTCGFICLFFTTETIKVLAAVLVSGIPSQKPKVWVLYLISELLFYSQIPKSKMKYELNKNIIYCNFDDNDIFLVWNKSSHWHFW